MAVSVAAAHIAKRDPEAVIINLPADHIVEDENNFAKSVHQAMKVAAEEKYIVVIALNRACPYRSWLYPHWSAVEDTPAFMVRGFKEKTRSDHSPNFSSQWSTWNGVFMLVVHTG